MVVHTGKNLYPNANVVTSNEFNGKENSARKIMRNEGQCSKWPLTNNTNNINERNGSSIQEKQG